MLSENFINTGLLSVSAAHQDVVANAVAPGVTNAITNAVAPGVANAITNAVAHTVISEVTFVP